MSFFQEITFLILFEKNIYTSGSYRAYNEGERMFWRGGIMCGSYLIFLQ